MKPKHRVFLLDDDELILSMLSRALRKEGYEVRGETASAGAVAAIRDFGPDVVLLDIRLPGKSGIEILEELVRDGIDAEVVMLTSDDSAETAVRAMKLGAADYLTKPFDLDEVRIVLRGLIEKETLRREVVFLRKVSEELLDHEILGSSPQIRGLRDTAERIASAGVPVVLITGESGTGKELLARHLHHRKCREAGQRYLPLVAVNCAALPEPLVESELFGHEKGAFTDARTDKRGVFESAHGGTVLLDEIGEMRPALQSKLLRVLEERTVRRVGGTRNIPFDATVIATTNRDLEAALARQEFRTDLFYRLSAFSLHIPPLRERREDIADLARHYLALYARKYNRRDVPALSPEAERLLLSHDWPGNVRELRNTVERIVVLVGEEEVLPAHLPKEILIPKPEGGKPPESRFLLPDSGISLDSLERDLIVQALEKAGRNKALAARLLDISYDSLRYQIKKFGLE